MEAIVFCQIMKRNNLIAETFDKSFAVFGLQSLLRPLWPPGINNKDLHRLTKD